MKALVTGGAGFIGSHLVDALVGQGAQVRGLDDFSTGSSEFVNSEADMIVGDVSDEPLVRQAVEGVEVVFHQAAHRTVQLSLEDPLATDLANTHGTLTVLKASADAGVRRVIYASSSSAYGGSDTRPTSETDATRPASPYAVSKLAGEHYCRVFTELFGLETVSLRYFNAYGSRQRPDSAYAAVIPRFIDALLRHTPPTIYGDGLQSRDFTFIDDVVSANIAAATAPAKACSGNVYNVAGGQPHTVLELLDALGEILSVRPRPVHESPRRGDPRHSWADITAARRDLGYSPRVSFEEGLRRTVAWFLNTSGVRVAGPPSQRSLQVGE